MLTLRPYQQAAIDAIYGYFAENTGHPVIVIPTAGGKSLVMASFVEGVLKAWPDQRILIVTHVRELIAQNHAELIGLWRDAPAGIYSAGRNVLGLMPHPENLIDGLVGGTDGRGMFESLVGGKKAA